MTFKDSYFKDSYQSINNSQRKKLQINVIKNFKTKQDVKPFET